MFIQHKSPTETVVELDRVEIALLIFLFSHKSPAEAVKATDEFLAAQPQGATDGK